MDRSRSRALQMAFHPGPVLAGPDPTRNFKDWADSGRPNTRTSIINPSEGGAHKLSNGPDMEGSTSTSDSINIQVFVPELNIQKCLQVSLDETIWDVKQKLLSALPKELDESFNYGLFLPPCNGRAGKFLQEERTFHDYPFQDCVPYLELKYKRRVYKLLNLDEKQLRQIHSKANLKKFLEAVLNRQVDKVEKLCSLGLDSNFHDSQGETPLTLASSLPESHALILALVCGGAHLDLRNLEGQTALHKAAMLSSHANVKTLLDLGASPNFRDPFGLTPLYYSVFRPGTNPNSTELLLRDYGELGVFDPHGNQEVHQACKNGLPQQLEHLLFYGADTNCRNVNGNTPLHVCALNNQEACARVLLFRGADPTIVNNQGQTAYHVAVVTGSSGIAELIKSHVPGIAVPYRGIPRYNSKRRLTWTRRTPSLARTKSAASVDYQNNGTLQRRSRSVAPSPQPSLSSASSMVGVEVAQTLPTEYRKSLLQNLRRKSLGEISNLHCQSNTLPLKRIPPENVPNHLVLDRTSDVNIPRILVIPRGPKGFGFILRGAKKMDTVVSFEPTLEVPALQYFEGVDMNGMSMRAGLKPGDFLLEINGEDVRCASHDQVVQLIQLSGDTITLKVVTVDMTQRTPPYYSTLPNRRKQAPTPPRRHPSTSLSCARGRDFLRGAASQEQYAVDSNFLMKYPKAGLTSTSRSMEHLAAIGSNYDESQQQKIASVRDRANCRRISAAELEQLMARQHQQNSTYFSGSSSPAGAAGSLAATISNSKLQQQQQPGPKVYASVSEMKRQKHQKHQHHSTITNNNNTGGPMMASKYMNNNGPETPPMKTFSISSPDLADDEAFEYAAVGNNGSPLYSNDHNAEAYSATPVYGYAQRQIPQEQQRIIYEQRRQQLQHYGVGSARDCDNDSEVFYAQHERNHQQYADSGNNNIYKRVQTPTSPDKTYSQPILRPKTPPPPPPLGGLHKPVVAVGGPPPPGPPPPPLSLKQDSNAAVTSKPPSGKTPPASNKGDCRGVTAEALTAVKLKSTPNRRESCGVPTGRVVGSQKSSANEAKSSLSGDTAMMNGGGAGGGITSQLLSQVKLKSVAATNAADHRVSADTFAVPLKQHQQQSGACVAQAPSSGEVGKQKGADFDSDLRSALARRRNQMQQKEPSLPLPMELSQPQKPQHFLVPETTQTTAVVNRLGLSLKESVQNSIGAQHKHLKLTAVSGGGNGGVVSGNSAIMNGGNTGASAGFVKKDSGYTSSRSSLEPSECGDHNEADSPQPPAIPDGLLNKADPACATGQCVSVLSRQIEDSLQQTTLPLPKFAQPPTSQLPNSQEQQRREQDSLSVSSTMSTTSACSSSESSSQDLQPSLPPPDYDDPDSGTCEDTADLSHHSSISQMKLAAGSKNTGRFTEAATPLFAKKAPVTWSTTDVCDWLDSLYLSEYKRRFAAAAVDGRQLLRCDRTTFTQLGVTRIAHRLTMENALKKLKPSGLTPF